jgi:S-layer protein (TIGR01564 family)
VTTRPAPANVAIGSNPVITTVAGAGGGTYNEAIPITNPIAKFASEVTADSTLDKNIVLVGGPCVNTIVKTLLDEDWNTTDSCNYWLNTHETLKTAGNGMLKIVEDVFGSGQKALIVAGTQGVDTRNLIANKVIKPTVYTALEDDEYIGAVA